MVSAMTDKQLSELVATNISMIELAYQNTALDSFKQKEQVQVLRDEIYQVWAEQRFRTKLRVKVQSA